MKQITLAVAFLVMFTTSVFSQDYGKGLTAFKAGNYATALREWKPLAEQGDARAQDYLGHMYYFGRGVPEDYAEAVKWYRKAAEQGETGAQVDLGILYEVGNVVPQDNIMAHMWYNSSRIGKRMYEQQLPEVWVLKVKQTPTDGKRFGV